MNTNYEENSFGQNNHIQKHSKTIGRNWTHRKTLWLPISAPNYLSQNLITDKKLRDKLKKEKDLRVPKTVEEIQQEIWQERRNTMPDAIISIKGKEIEEQMNKITYTGKTGARRKRVVDSNPTNWILMRNAQLDNRGTIAKRRFAKVSKQRR